MRRLTTAALATILTLGLAVPVSAAGPNAGRGFLPPHARVHGHTLTELASAWDAWAFGTPADVNPLLANRCEPSPIDPKIWFMPVSLGGDYDIDCAVPVGAFIVVTPGGYECSEAEGNGSSEADLRACADYWFSFLNVVEVTLDGRAARHLDRYVVTTAVSQLPGPNLLGDEPTPSLMKGYFVVINPLSRGTHTLRAYDEFAVDPVFTAGITIHLSVGRH